MSLLVPVEWNLASFSGDAATGNLRADDDEGPRLELRWEQPRGAVDLDRSIEKFIEGLERQAKKKKEPFKAISNPHVLKGVRPDKVKIVNFGWSGRGDSPIAGQGYGVAWECSTCGRVVVGHVMARGRERAEKVRGLASEVLSTLECHGKGGWQTWSVFGLRLEVPEEFQLSQAKLLTGRIEMEWMRPAPPPPRGWLETQERLRVTRVALANVLLERESLEQWTERNVARPDRRLKYGASEATQVHGHEAITRLGVERDPRRRLAPWLLDLALRRRTPPAQLQVWHCPESNKLYTVLCKLSTRNAHVCADVIDSMECH